MAVIISNGSTTLATASGFYRVEAYNLGMFSTTDLVLSSTRTIAITFANAGNCQGIVLALATTDYNINRSVQVDLQQNTGSWVTVQTVTLTANQITNSETDKRSLGWIVPFTITPQAVTTAASTWRFQLSQTGGSTGNWSTRTSDATNPFYATWCDNAVTFASTDVVIAKDIVTIDATVTFRGLAGTGDTARSVCAIACRSTTPTPDNVAMFVWENAPVSAYTLTIDGYCVISAHSGFRVGTALNPIPAAQKATITIQRVPTTGTAGNSGFVDAESSTGANTMKSSFFLYGAIPTYQRTTLAADAAITQKNIITAVDLSAQWIAGDTIFVGRQNTQGNGDVTSRTISSFSGTTITLSSNLLTAIRKTGGMVLRMNGYGIILNNSSTTTVICYLRNPSNFVLSGVQIVDISFILAVSAQTAQSDIANRSQYIVQSCSSYFTTQSQLLNVCPIENGMLINDCSFVQSTFIGNHYHATNSNAGNLGLSGNITITNNWLTIPRQVATIDQKSSCTISSNIFENSSVTFLSLAGIDATFQSNFFWGCSSGTGGCQLLAMIDGTTSLNQYENNTIAFFFGASFTKDCFFENWIFGSITANTLDIDFAETAFVEVELSSPTGALSISSTNQKLTTLGSHFRISDFNDTPNDDRGYLKYGNYQRCGDGLADTTVRTSGIGKFCIRLAPNDSVNTLDIAQVIPIGNIQNLVMSIAVWVKINNANYYAGVHQNPKLTATYDNGVTQISNDALDSTAWQLLFVSFDPTTTFGQITITISGATDATGTNAYFYIDDFNLAYPAGYTLNLGGLDLWANAMPIFPAISTIPASGNLWDELLTSHLSAGTFGQCMKNLFLR